MKRIFAFSLLLFVAIFSCTMASAQTDAKAKAILDRSSLRIRQGDTRIDFTLFITDTKTEKTHKFNGYVLMKGNKFFLNLPMSQTFFNGKTQYVYVRKNNEVSVTTPTKKQLEEINPAFMLASYASKGTSVQFSLDNASSKDDYVIDVFPAFRSKKDYYKAITRIDRKTLTVESIKVLAQNGVHSTFKVNRIQTDQSYNDAIFTFYPRAYPKVVINDLR